MNRHLQWLLWGFLTSISMVVHAQNASHDVWQAYVDGSVGKPLNYLFVDARAHYFTIPSHYRALDLGSGSGNEALDLLHRHWEVSAIDASPRAGEVLKARAHTLRNHLNFQVSDFSHVSLDGDYDFVFSLLALPFGNKQDLPTLVQNITQHMKKGAVFAVNFFGYQHSFVTKKEAYGMDKAEIFNLFSSHQLNIVYYLNRVYDQKDFSGNPTHWDVIDVIGIKQ